MIWCKCQGAAALAIVCQIPNIQMVNKYNIYICFIYIGTQHYSWQSTVTAWVPLPSIRSSVMQSEAVQVCSSLRKICSLVVIDISVCMYVYAFMRNVCHKLNVLVAHLFAHCQHENQTSLTLAFIALLSWWLLCSSSIHTYIHEFVGKIFICLPSNSLLVLKFAELQGFR